ncbi:MAG: flagellar basal body rod protein FlgB [Deltaproteobacteria bacterium]|nr:flagellar basal body rod protein FlgB [Deltaproteobacteria bacterium]
MPWNPFQDNLIDILEHSLTWQSRRHEIIAGNVANLDTPNYTGKELDFKALLAGYANGGPRVRLTATHPGHIQGELSTPAGFVQDTGKAVDIDREMVAMAENQLSFQASAQMLGKKLEGLRTVIEGDRR